MLYNKDWNKNDKDINSLDNLIEWLGRQDPAKGYIYYSPRNCLLAQYYRAQGLSNPHVGRYALDYVGGYVNLPDGFDAIAKGKVFTNTIGHALNRALKLRKAQEAGLCLTPAY
jgi:hypothetical protein